MTKKKPKALLIDQLFNHRNEAHAISIQLRKQVLQKIGYKPDIFYHRPTKKDFLFDFIHFLKICRRYQVLYLRVDGSSIAEKFSILKIFHPRLLVLWDIHGDEIESLWGTRNLKAYFTIAKRGSKRRILAKLVDGAICFSPEIKSYAQKKLGIKKSFFIPNFMDKTYLKQALKTKKNFPFTTLLNNKKVFKVFWGGGAIFPWQALDIIEKVAQRIYHQNKDIIFFVIGSPRWHKFTFTKNVVLLPIMPRTQYIQALSSANLCLALYHRKDKYGSVFHFTPLKILDYMALAKPVIATNVGYIKTVIKDKKNGFLTNNRIADIVKKILWLKKNPSRASEIGQKAQKKVFTNYGLDKATKKYKRVFTNLGLL